ncbi:MAG: hypothetical protein AAFQ43_03970 [Bacteroidota bacterium]
MLAVLATSGAWAQRVVDVDRAALPEAAFAELQAVNLRSADLRDVFRAIADETGLNVVVDDAVTTRATVNLGGVSALDAVLYLAEEYGLSVQQSGPVLRIRPAAPEPPAPLDIRVAGGQLSADLRGADLRAVTRRITEASGVTVVPGAGVEGTVTAFVENVEVEAGLEALFESNGFVVRRQGAGTSRVYTVDYLYDLAEAPDGEARQGLYVRTDSTGRFELDLRNASVAAAVREIGRRSRVGVTTYTVPQGRVTLSAAGLTLEDALGAVLRGTGASYRREGAGYVVGSSEADGVVATRLLTLGYIDVDGVLELVPEAVRQGVTVQTVPEQNAILATGPNDRIGAVAAFLREIDRPPPQVFIEAVVVDFLDTDASELGFSFGLGLFGSDSTGERLPSGYVLDGLGSGAGEVRGDGDDANAVLDALGDAIGVRNLGRLPQDFFYRIRALEQEGRVEVRSRPQVATLNGTPAVLSVGTTQYFILRDVTPIGVGGNQVITQERTRFETIEANVSLQVTPFVGPDGVVTAVIIPEFSQPIGEFDPELQVPPTISTRRIESTVRLRDGETIILGGLVEDRDVIDDRKVPILGSIPLLGRLFRSRVRSRRRSELVIYLTPRVFYGGEDEGDRWRRLARELDVTDSPFEREDAASPEAEDTP